MMKLQVFPIVLGFALCLASAFVVFEAAAQSADDVVAGFDGDIGGAQQSVNQGAVIEESPVIPGSFSGADVEKTSTPASDIGAKYIEWFGMNLGGGYIHNTMSFGRIDVHLATINWPQIYYTMFEGNVFPYLGMAGVGGRLGWRKVLGRTELRLGSGLGFAYWVHYKQEGDSRGHVCGEWRNTMGIGITPHFQILRRFRHGTFGIGLDIPILVDVFDALATSGAHIYLRWSVF